MNEGGIDYGSEDENDHGGDYQNYEEGNPELNALPKLMSTVFLSLKSLTSLGYNYSSA